MAGTNLKLATTKLIPTSIKPHLRTLYQELRSLAYVGSTVSCPCCDRSFSSFLPGGYNARPSVRCPRCNLLERHRLLWLFLLKETELFSSEIYLLHVAPEAIFQSKLKRISTIQYLSVDLISDDAMINMDITEIDMSDNVFDVILCNHVLEHIPDDEQAMSELYRVLKPGGWAILQVPIEPEREHTYEDLSDLPPVERKRIFGHHDHMRIYGRDYKARLESAGFTVTTRQYARELGDADTRKYGLQSDEDIYYCEK